MEFSLYDILDPSTLFLYYGSTTLNSTGSTRYHTWYLVTSIIFKSRTVYEILHQFYSW